MFFFPDFFFFFFFFYQHRKREEHHHLFDINTLNLRKKLIKATEPVTIIALIYYYSFSQKATVVVFSVKRSNITKT